MKIRILCFFWLLTYPAFAKVITYKAPPCNFLSKEYILKVREPGGQWQQVDVYHARVANVINTKMVEQKTSFAYFDCSENVEISVTVPSGNLNSVKVRPLSSGIKPVVKGNTITFVTRAGQNVSVEVNGNIFQNLQVFANTIEKDPPSIQDTSVIYFGPGIHQVGRMQVASGKTIYMAGGSVVVGSFAMDHVKNVRISGRGILTQYDAETPTTTAIKNPRQRMGRNDGISVVYSENVQIEGLIVLPRKYTALIGQSARVKISDLRSFSSEGNADGIDIFSSKDVTLDHLFMRNSDDCIAIYGHRWRYYGNTQNINILNSTLWADVAHPILIGTHGDTQRPDTLSDMKFNNIDILDQQENQMDYQGCMSLNAGDSNLIQAVTFNDIRVEDIRKGQLFNLRVMFNRKYNTSAGAGIKDILFKNVTYSGRNAPLSVISGYDERRNISNVVFENLQINGKLISDKMDGKPSFYKTGDMANIFVGEHVENIRFNGTL
ncbi:glycosyl hydrolase family 28 protein [Mucilaginibacter sp. AW1-3]